MAYTRINWQDLPNTTTPRNATNLNKMDAAIKEHDDELLGNASMGNVVVDSIRSKNIFDEIWTNGTINSGNGSVDSTYSSYSITNVNLIPVKPNTQYVISFSGGNYVINRIATFNSSGTFISRSASLNTTTFTTDSNTYFIRFNIWDDNGMSISSVGNTQIEKGSTATNYTPYQGIGYVSGSNANGSYIKYNDGTLIQWNSLIVSDQAINSHYGDSVLYTGTRTIIFPIPFIDTNYSAFCGEFHWGTSASWGVVYNKNSTNWMTLMIYDFYTRNSGTNTSVSWTAIGKWK